MTRVVLDSSAIPNRLGNNYTRAMEEFKKIERKRPWYDFAADGKS